MRATPAGRFEWEKALRDVQGISPALTGVLLLLATYADRDGTNVRPSLSSLANTKAWSRSTLTKHVKDGVRLGWLEVTEDRSDHGKPSTYRLTVPQGDRENDRGCLPQRQGVPATTTGGDRLVPHNQTSTTPDTTPNTTEARAAAELDQGAIEAELAKLGPDPTGPAAWRAEELQRALADFAPDFG